MNEKFGPDRPSEELAQEIQGIFSTYPGDPPEHTDRFRAFPIATSDRLTTAYDPELAELHDTTNVMEAEARWDIPGQLDS